MAGVQWYVTLEGVEQGPLTPGQVKELVAAGAIGVTTPIRREGMDKAVPAAAVKGLLPESVVAQARQAGPSSQAPASAASGAPAPDAAELGDTRRMPQAGDAGNRTTRRAPASLEPADDAGEAQARDEEPAAILCTLTVDDNTSSSGEPRYMLGSEPILTPAGEPIVDRKGRRSYVTSAGSGPSVGKHLLLAYLPPEYAQEGTALKVEYLGEQYPVTVAVAGSTPLFDPDNERMKR